VLTLTGLNVVGGGVTGFKRGVEFGKPVVVGIWEGLGLVNGTAGVVDEDTGVVGGDRIDGDVLAETGVVGVALGVGC
jgi:hypothetical protein